MVKITEVKEENTNKSINKTKIFLLHCMKYNKALLLIFGKFDKIKSNL